MRFSKSLIILALSASLAACGDSDNNEVEVTDPVMPVMSYEFTVQVTNLTNAQPLSPIAAIAHSEGMLWQIGEPASAALELMAEGGDNSELLATDFAMASSSALLLRPLCLAIGFSMAGSTSLCAVSAEVTAGTSASGAS